ncbi:unnamed protein product [Vitrella brassicaformis CCMP3155]|uniref:Uncharacterized protein n=1 Tax=Vitrella brassicaformis (strain CCMP3155) TaxID=1169540 RepID=A0A0G4GKF0_VITBC|nr:unnamed protein product [Vitrella brassicaformis CCMP3155]|eukprot:CEM30501.1 unnamed protein product [Vitrella brassicaformis CCMP3155]
MYGFFVCSVRSAATATRSAGATTRARIIRPDVPQTLDEPENTQQYPNSAAHFFHEAYGLEASTDGVYPQFWAVSPRAVPVNIALAGDPQKGVIQPTCVAAFRIDPNVVYQVEVYGFDALFYEPWQNRLPITNARVDDLYILITILKDGGLQNRGSTSNQFLILPQGSFVWSGVYPLFAKQSDGQENLIGRIPYRTIQFAIFSPLSGYFVMELFNVEPALLGGTGLALGAIASGGLERREDALPAGRQRNSVTMWFPGSQSQVHPFDAQCKQIMAKEPPGSVSH